MINIENGKWRKILDTKTLNKQIADFFFKMHNSSDVKNTITLRDGGTSLDLTSAFHHLIVQTESQSYLALNFLNNNCGYGAMPFRTKYSPINFAIAMVSIMQQIQMKTEVKMLNFVDGIFLLHQFKEHLKNIIHKVIETLKYFGFTTITEKSETEPKQRVIFMGQKWNLINAIVKIKPKKKFISPKRFTRSEKLIKFRNRDNNKAHCQINREIKFFKTIILRSITLPERNGRSESKICKVKMMKCNDVNEQDCNTRFKLVDRQIQSEHSSIVETDIITIDNGNGCNTQRIGFNTKKGIINDNKGSQNLEKMISEIYKQHQGNQRYNLRPTKFQKKNLNNWQIQSLAIGNDNCTAVFDIRKWSATLALKMKITYGYQTTENLGIQILVTHLPGVKNEIADALSRLSRAEDYQLIEKVFQQTFLQMKLNPIIDLFSQHLNNIVHRFMSSISGHWEITIYTLNLIWKKEFPWIHPPIHLLPAVLMKIREERKRAMIVAPLWQGQIQYIELVNKNHQIFMLGWSNEILEPGILLIKRNMKLHPGKICCFLIDRRPGREEDMQERF
ncbi:MAG: hypothetical protein EZS28_028405 [Streblomastix strix]|uniref:Reverse transcriptase domain-containing protein n=1 Tax=Streblomastix strix TaxID=222440 RepID=A0A5J4V018_9EUKA|nr:MAG: hypothetical protein EZS28_028405 [Streblomastix strix]